MPGRLSAISGFNSQYGMVKHRIVIDGQTEFDALQSDVTRQRIDSTLRDGLLGMLGSDQLSLRRQTGSRSSRRKEKKPWAESTSWNTPKTPMI